MKQLNNQPTNNLTVNNKGVTLIEMLAAVTVFAITVGAISGIFVSAIRTQRRVLAIQELLDQTSYVLEYMGRALRMARKELNCLDPTNPATCDPANPSQCLTTIIPNGYGYNYEINGNRIRFINYNLKCQEFFYEGNQLKSKISQDHTASAFLEPLPLTAITIRVESLNFSLSGESQDDSLQPRVTILMEVKGRGATEERPKIQIQTSISQRSLDVEY